MQNDDFFFAGVAIALSIVHGGPGPQFISPSLYKALTTNPDAMQENPTSFSTVMCHQPQQFTYCSFSSLMEPELNLPGSSKRNTENLVVSFWRNLLLEIEGKVIFSPKKCPLK